MPTTDRKLHVFLCHASQDKPIVRELYQRLLAEGWIDPWLDKEKLLPGQDWELEIEKSVENADVVIVCLSKSSVEKEGYYQKEIKKVLDTADLKPEGTIFMIPLRLDDCQVPRRLARWQYEDYFPKKTRDKMYSRVLHSLEIRANSLALNIRDLRIPDHRDKQSNLKIEKAILFHLETEPKLFVDWFYQNFYYKNLSQDKSKNLPLKASDYFYKPFGQYKETDPTPFKLITERVIDDRVYKGTITVEIEPTSSTPNPRISVTLKFDEDDFFLVFYRMLASIAKVYKESRDLIMPYLDKYRSQYEEINQKWHVGKGV